MNPALETLFLPFENGDTPYTSPALFLHAQNHPALKSFGALDVSTPFYPDAETLKQFSKDSHPSYQTALILIPKQVDEAKYALANAYQKLDTGGVLIAAAANDANGNRLEGWFKELGLAPSSHSKNKCRVVWATKHEVHSICAESWIANGLPRATYFDEDNFMTQPGVFSWNKIDAGSKLLVAHIADLKGEGADFGCGIGYLSHHIKDAKIHAIDADSRALFCAQQNLHGQIVYHWADLSKPVSDLPPLDFIVMNPPFHTGKDTKSSLGQDFVKTAAHHLKKGGKLIMVSNAHLPYESTLQELFSKMKQIEQKDGFKIIEAVK